MTATTTHPWGRSLLTALLCALGAGVMTFYPLTESDIWWHLAAGREMVSQGNFLRVDPFAYTPSLPWIDVHWLFQLLAYILYSQGGGFALLGAKFALVMATVVVAHYASPAAVRPAVVVPLYTVVFFVMRFVLPARPLLVTLLCMSLVMLIMEHYARHSRPRVVLWLVAVQLVWTNTQGLFALGPVMVGCYVVSEAIRWLRSSPKCSQRLRVLAGGWLLMTAATLVNPYGWRGALFPLRLFKRIDPSLHNIYAFNVSENIPLIYLWKSEPHSVVLVVVVALLGVAAVVMTRGRRVEQGLLLGACGLLAFMAQRNIPLLMIVALPLLGSFLSQRTHWFTKRFLSSVRSLRVAKALYTAVVVLVVGGAAAAHGTMLYSVKGNGAWAPFRHPFGAVEKLKQVAVAGNVFNDIRHGGYLIWELYPQKKVFIDGRLIIRTPQFFADFLEVLDNPDSFDRVVAQWNITQVIVPIAIFERFLPLAKKLYHDPAWSLVYCDAHSVLFVKSALWHEQKLDLSSPHGQGVVERELHKQFGNSPLLLAEARYYVKNFVRSLDLLAGPP
jgi:hypothetical protein